jgi:acetyl-CoA carboxylase carboxyltransferase component
VNQLTPMAAVTANAVHDARTAHLDDQRADALDRIRARGSLTARERIDRLLDAGSFLEYGMLAEPAPPDLDGSGDGVVTGLGMVDGRPVAVISFDYSVYGGTQGQVGHVKIDAILERALHHRLPLVIFNEGGGTRAQEMGNLPRDTKTFVLLSRLAAAVPVACAVLGRAFAGNANIAGLSNFVVATRSAVIGLGGPPLVEAAFGQRLTPEEIGAIEIHELAGAVDVVVDDDDAAIEAVRLHLSYFTERVPPADVVEPGSPAAVRAIVPEEPRRGYDVRELLVAVADAGSVQELRPRFAASVVTAYGRLGGWSVAFVANQPMVKAGCLDADAADKVAHFVRHADRFGHPIVFLVDTPGFLVGPAVEATGLVKRSAEIVHALARAEVPILTVLVRKAYGFAAMAMGGQPFMPVITLAWPTAEFGAMGFEGASRLLNETADKAEHRERAEHLREQAGGWGMAAKFHVDDLIDPAETRPKLIQALDTISG